MKTAELKGRWCAGAEQRTPERTLGACEGLQVRLCSEIKRRLQGSFWGLERSLQSHLGGGREANKEALAQWLLHHFS